jgi:DNA invertase Pin-like site-specific DNA recombinase
MKIFAYTYSDPLLEPTPDPTTWEWELDAIYQDLGKRSQLQKLFNDCKTEPPNCLLIRRLEELGDTLDEVSSRLAELEVMGITLIAVEQDYNSSQDSPNLRAELLKLLYEIQHEQRSRRIRQGHARNRLDAAPPPGKAPYGYRRGKGKYIIDRTTSPVVKDFFEHFLLYGSLRGSVRHLAKKYGKKISVTTGRRWLTNPVYRGDTAYQNGEIISNTHAPIITREEAAQVDRLLRRNSRLPPRTASAPRSLAGLVVCNECQSHMSVTRVTMRKQEKEYLYLRPITCPKHHKCRALPYQQVLEQTIQTVCRDLPLAVALMNFPQLDAVKNSLNEAISRQQEVLNQLPCLLETGVLDVETAKLRAYKIRTEMSALQAKLATLPPVNLRSVAQAVSIPQFWLDLSEAERRFYFREFIRQIEIIRQDKEWELRVIFIF